MRTNGDRPEWFATREVQGLGDDGDREVVTVWIERRPGAVWAVGRAVGLAQRADGAVADDDYVFEGYEMGTRSPPPTRRCVATSRCPPPTVSART